jgi:hypothetical protein
LKRVAILIAASPTTAFYSQIAALLLALRQLSWGDWTPSVHVFLGGPPGARVEDTWRVHLEAASFHWVSDRYFATDGDWAQSDDLMRCAPRDADVLLALDADTFPVASLTDLLDEVHQGGAVAGVIAHYPFPRFPGCSVREGWQHVTEGILEAPLEFKFSHTLMAPGTPESLRMTPFYVNGGVVFFPGRRFAGLVQRYLEIRPRLMSRMPNPDFTGQAAVTLAIAACGIPVRSLPMRYNFPNDPIADEQYPDELARAAVLHYLRTDTFDRHRIFTSAAEYDRFLSLELSGSNRSFQQHVEAVLGSKYPFGRG